MSIIDPKYKGRYTKDNKDWVSRFIDEQCGTPITKDVKKRHEDGTTYNETVDTGKISVGVLSLFDLANKNGIDTAKYSDSVEAAGRMRMTVGNMLRAAARRRHGLNGLDGEFNAADPEFLENAPAATERPDGTRLKADAPTTGSAPAEQDGQEASA